MKKVCILLERDKVRVEHVNKNIKPIIDDLEIFSAVDANTNQIDKLLEKEFSATPLYLRHCKRGQLGATLSHLSIWKNIVKDRVEKTLILEDDANLPDDFKEKLNEILEETPNDFDLLYLFVHPRQFKKIEEDSQYFIGGKKYITKAYRTWGMVGYVISLFGAQKILEYFKTIRNNVDLQLMDYIHEINSFSVNFPFIKTVGQLDEFDSKSELKSNIWSTEKHEHRKKYNECIEVLQKYGIDENVSLEYLMGLSIQEDSKKYKEILWTLYLLSILLYYIEGKDNKNKALRISEKLLHLRGVEKIIPLDAVFNNRKFFLPVMSELSFIDYLGIDIEPPTIKDNIKYNVCNPSIISDFKNNLYYINYRMVNYENIRGRMSSPFGCKDYFTKNFLCKLDKEMNLIWVKEILDFSDKRKWETRFKGLEDIQLFIEDDTINFLCTTFGTKEIGCEMSLGRLSEEENVIVVKNLIQLRYEKNKKYEKNWLYCGDKKFIYSHEPLTILKYNDEKCLNVSESYNNINCSHYRNSAGPLNMKIKGKDGYLFLIHEVISMEGGERMYLHKFLFYDRDFNLIFVSVPFKFFDVYVDYCRSMCLSLDKKFLYIGVGIEDKEAEILTIPISKMPFFFS